MGRSAEDTCGLCQQTGDTYAPLGMEEDEVWVCLISLFKINNDWNSTSINQTIQLAQSCSEKKLKKSTRHTVGINEAVYYAFEAFLLLGPWGHELSSRLRSFYFFALRLSDR